MSIATLSPFSGSKASNNYLSQYKSVCSISTSAHVIRSLTYSSICDVNKRISTNSFTRGSLIIGNLSIYGAHGKTIPLRVNEIAPIQTNYFELPRERGIKKNVSNSPRASFLGVGAPEALVIAVVALLVFGPKGLAEVARNLGNTLKSFQPTIRELQQVSRDFKDTLEQEIGLDEIRSNNYKVNSPSVIPPPPTASPPATQTIPEVLSSPAPPPSSSSSPPEQLENPPSPKAYTSEDYLRLTQEQLQSMAPEDMRKMSEIAAWKGVVPNAQKESTQNPISIDQSTSASLASSSPPSALTAIAEKKGVVDTTESTIDKEPKEAKKLE